jgi:DNA polymerase-1
MRRVVEMFTRYTPSAAAFDTETDGLHIIQCKPFLFQFGWWHEPSDTIFAFAIDILNTIDFRIMYKEWRLLVALVPVNLAHNVKFDLHMLANIGLDMPMHNLSDTQFYIRFANDNVSARQGGVLLGLKDYCVKHISSDAKLHESEIQAQRSSIARRYNEELKKALGWTGKQMDEFFGDRLNGTEDFPNVESLLAYTRWKHTLPKTLQHVWGKIGADDITYDLVDRRLVVRYGLDDIVWTLLIYRQCAPVIEARGTQPGLDIENDLILPLYEMERHGLPLDTDYVELSKQRMRKYIRNLRKQLCISMGADVKATQSKVIGEWLRNHGIDVQSTGSEVLNQLHNRYPNELEALAVVEIIQELRTLEKWYSTYLMRFYGHDKVYTQINQVGAASLRMSSDFQQFPKEGLTTYDGKELFNPRRAIKVGVNPMVYLDYSQIELRVQALYTILVDHPDVNLCRAYMPYKCRSTTELVEFDYTNKDHRARWNTGEWVQLEDGKHWEPLDVHGATTKAAFDIDETHEKFKSLRQLGKRVNFAKNYGAQRGKIAEMFPDQPAEIITAIDQGYYKAFPGVRHYQNYCYNIGEYQFYATNLFGIRYWKVSGHNLINMLIQGGSATLIKLKIIAIYDFLKPYKTKMVLPVHDEIQFDMPKEEFHLIPRLQEIMEDWDDCYIPIVADAEVSYTNWAEKEDLCVLSE